MILPEGEVGVFVGEDGRLYFEHDGLGSGTVVFPLKWEGGLGTIEFSRHHVTFHPPNGPSKTFTADEWAGWMRDDHERGHEDGSGGP